MIKWRQKLVDAFEMFKADSLFRNAVYLMASTAIMAFLGFAFWLFVARLYSPADIGVASALISATTMISNFSLLGLQAGLIRFLPTSKHPSRDINAAMLAVGLAAVVATAIYLTVTVLEGIGLQLIGSSPFNWVMFAALMAAVALNTLTDSVFIANRRAEYHLLVYAAFGLIKLILPLFLVPFGSAGIFLAYSAAVVVSLGLSIYFMRRACDYHVASNPNWQLLLQTRRYMTGNYFSMLLSGLPSQLMPMLIIRHMGADSAAYFSMAIMMANFIYVVPSSMTQSLLAESSHDSASLSRHVKQATRILAMILIPGVSVAIAVAPYLLQVFGANYAAGSAQIFQLLAAATVFVTINSIGGTILNLQRRPLMITAVQLAIAITTLSLVQVLAQKGLPGIGMAMLLGYAAGSVVYGILYIDRRWWRPVRRSEPKSDLAADLSSGQLS